MNTNTPQLAAGPVARSCSQANMLAYSLGECANSLVTNGIFGFAMLYYTKALGLSPTLAGIAMSVSVFWEAFSEPIMGHVSDNTRSRWGRRHPYMILGGSLMALCSYLVWAVPEGFKSSQSLIFWYLVVINLLLRTGLTLFFIPYMALGFEICQDYQGRSKIQGQRYILGMAANFAGPAMAWSFFFKDKNGVQATTVVSNYIQMGTIFAIATAMAVLITVVLTFRWRQDTSQHQSGSGGAGVAHFFKEMRHIIADPNPRWVFVFIFLVCAGMVLVSSLQMFVYDDFMHFNGGQKSIAHGSTMIGFALGSAFSVFLSKMLEKRNVVLAGCIISVAGNIMLGVIFLTNWMPVNASGQLLGFHIPMSLVIFVLFHATYWFGNGILLPIATAMMADVAEVNELQTGENKDGSYSSVFSLSMRLAISFSMMASGYCLELIGYQVPGKGEAVSQSALAIWRLGAVTFAVGSIIAIIASFTILKYPITRQRLEELRRQKTLR